MGLIEYLDVQRARAEESRIRWRQEFDLFCELAEFYERLCAAIKISDKKVKIPSELFLVVIKLMYGVASQILCGRLSDADMLTRGAIEATAISYRLWKNHELIEIYQQAYPNIGKTEDPSQWKLSKAYYKNFSTGKLFDQEGETWDTLKHFYGMCSAMATHAGPGALASHETRKNTRFLSFLEVDEEDIKRHWYSLMAAYYEMLKVYLRILRGSWAGPEVGIFEKDLIAWRDKTGAMMEQRAPKKNRNEGSGWREDNQQVHF